MKESDKLFNKSHNLVEKAERQRIIEDYGVDLKNISHLEPLNQFMIIPDKDFMKEAGKCGVWKIPFLIMVFWVSCMIGFFMGSIMLLISPLFALIAYIDKKEKAKKKSK